MNTDTSAQIIQSDPIQPDQAPSDQTSSNSSPPNLSRKPRGKIAELPKAQRDLINKMLHDGATYGVVIAEMIKHGVSLNGENVSNWYHSGFQEYLEQQDWLTQMNHLKEDASDLPDPSNLTLHQAVLQVAVLKIFKSLKNNQNTGDPMNDIRQLNALARISRVSAHVKKQTDQELVLSQLDPDRDPAENELKAWARRFDRFLLTPRPWLDQPPAPVPAPTTPTDNK